MPRDLKLRVSGLGFIPFRVYYDLDPHLRWVPTVSKDDYDAALLGDTVPLLKTIGALPPEVCLRHAPKHEGCEDLDCTLCEITQAWQDGVWVFQIRKERP